MYYKNAKAQHIRDWISHSLYIQIYPYKALSIINEFLHLCYYSGNHIAIVFQLFCI